MKKGLGRLWGAALAAVLAAGLGAGPAHAVKFTVTNLVSDGSAPALTIDPSLINPWGIAFAPDNPFWISDNNAGVSTLYNGGGGIVPLTVAIPPPHGQTGAGTPTGTVFNGASGDFVVKSGKASGSALFLFATEDGTIAGWSPGVNFTNAILAVDNSKSGAVYKGLALATIAGKEFLYASNFRAGDIEVYNSNFKLVKTFTDPSVAAGYAPFNVQVLDGKLYVTFALQDAAKHDDVAGAGHGYVDVFNLNGKFLKRLVSLGGKVNSPWGLDIAPSSFGKFANDLLVGNFGNGTISAFDAATGKFEGDLLGSNGKPIVVKDLWALTNAGALGSNPDDIYFTAGLADEQHGLFGSINGVPEPATWAMLLLGYGGLGAAVRARRKSMPAAV